MNYDNNRPRSQDFPTWINEEVPTTRNSATIESYRTAVYLCVPKLAFVFLDNYYLNIFSVYTIYKKKKQSKIIINI